MKVSTIISRLEERKDSTSMEAAQEIRKLHARLDACLQDIEDMHNSPQTIFSRCTGCKRLRSDGYMCPTIGCKEGE